MPVLALFAPLPPANLKMDFRPREGLRASLDGVPVIQGSSVQLFGTNGQGLYSSRWSDQRVARTAHGFRVEWDSPDVTGTIDVALEDGTLTLHHHIVAIGDVPIKAELAMLLYAEPWRSAVQTPPVPKDRPSRRSDEIPGRELARGTDARFESRRAALSVHGDPSLLVFDADGYTADWASGASRYWSGYEALPLAKDAPIDVTTTYRFEGGFAGGVAPMTVGLAARPLPNAVGPVESRPPLIPRPATVQLDYGTPVEISGAWSFPAGRPRRLDDFRAALARRFELPPPRLGAPGVAIDGGLHDFKLPIGSYELTITPKTITILGQEDEGMLNAVERLATLAFVKDGRLYLPTGVLRDGPRRSFRGVHLFVGPTALAFQQRLWTRVLRPLGLNTVVLQCERTAWDAVPTLRGGIVMPKADLAALAKWYRSRTVEPIPLVQSFGHMEWLFAGGANRDLAFDPANPHAIDPRLPRGREVLDKIWDEAIAATGAKTLHFGLDEINLPGGPQDPSLVTELWRTQLTFLSSIAARNGARPMLWGDMALAPEEAPDGANGVDPNVATIRRGAIPANAIIADWHYKADPKPATFVRSLQAWKNAGLTPVASAWYRPENVRGLNLAADLERVGTLQTTWAGYESSEATMLDAMDQYTAMVLAADYSWSGRQDAVSKLGYDPAEVFRRMYFDAPMPLAPVKGTALTLATGGAGAGSNALSPEAIELARRTGVHYTAFGSPIALRNLESDGPLVVELPIPTPIPAKRIYFQASVATRLAQGDPVARVIARLAGGKSVETTVRYGLDVVVAGDHVTTQRSASFGGLSNLVLDLPAGSKLAGLRLVASAPHTGFVLRGVTLR